MSKPREIVSAASLAVAVVALGGASVAFADSGRDPRVHEVEMEDDCDPETFNAVPVPGGCVGDGDTTFQELFDELVEDGEHGKWRFHPDELTIRRHDRLEVVNEGGEVHTFTEVKRFGGGCVPEVNAVLGLTPVAECGPGPLPQNLPPVFFQTLVLQGASMDVGPLSAGKHRFMCLIHPWMQSTVEVENRR